MKSVRFHAHTKNRPDGAVAPESEWEPLYTGPCVGGCADCERLSPGHGHLNKVAYWTARYAEEMFAEGTKEARIAYDWGYVTGLWHDLGKFSNAFQERLHGEQDRVDHSTAGARYIADHFDRPPFGQMLAYLIAGHHAGLADWNRNGSDADLSNRLGNTRIPDWKSNVPEDLLKSPILEDPPCQRQEAAFFARLLFSCLVDADFLATEGFMNPDRMKRRVNWPKDVMVRMERALEHRSKKFGDPKEHVDVQRCAVREACLKAAEKKPGLFTLTVPTGGGKTLSSLAFAIRHAIEHRLERIVYVIPYTSIIEQNAKEFRETFAALSTEIGHDVVLEHHSSFEPEEEGGDDRESVWRLTAENWDAPLVVTTNVQFFESLYANKTSRCRKLHNIARSVMIFDEAQNLPVEVLSPCLDAIRHLTDLAGCTAVLCTATQPAIGKKKEEFPVGLDLDPDREIVPDPKGLYRDLRRVTLCREPEPFSDDKLVERLGAHERVLCIVNTKPHATRVFEKLGADDPTNVHLSAQLCPAHRQIVLAEVRRREEQTEPCRLVATPVVEAGVDIDFPAVYRAMTGLDSFAQAAGRCNRHDRYQVEDSKAVLFEPAETKVPGFLMQNVNASGQVLPDYEDLLGIEAIEQYFRQYYFLQGKPFGWDKEKVLDCFHVQQSKHPFLFDFRTAAKRFRLIPDLQKPIIIDPKDGLWEGMNEWKSAEIRALIAEIQKSHHCGYPPPRDVHRKLQRYTVQVSISIWDEAKRNGKIEVYHDRLPVLTHPENNYDEKLGLQLNSNKVSAFII